MTRETIYAALFAKVSSAAGLVTASRRIKLWVDVPAAKQPALFQIEKHQIMKQQRGMPPKYYLHAELYLYVNAGNNPDAVSSTLLNNMLDAIEASLAPDDPMGNVYTLGGLVSHCWISGTIETDEGALGAQAVAIIPIEILTA